MCGNRGEISWTDSERKVSFFDLKGHIINCLTRLGIQAGQYTLQPYESDIYSQAIACVTRGGKVLAHMGIVSKSLLKAFLKSVIISIIRQESLIISGLARYLTNTGLHFYR